MSRGKGIPGAIYQPLNVTSEVAKHQLGDIYPAEKGVYVYAYNADTTAINLGFNVVIETAATNFSVVLSGATSVMYAGLVEQKTVPTAHYFWLLREGMAQHAWISGAVVAGGPVYPTAGGALSATAPTGLATAGINVGAQAHGYALEAIASGASGKVMYKAL